MRLIWVAPLAGALALGCGRTNLPCAQGIAPSDDCALDPEQYPAECDGALAEAPSCEGTGRIWSSTDECIDDGASNGTGDLLEVYCVDNLARFCLSHEDCPWRDGGNTAGELSCSASGLSSSYMANMINGCPGWQGHDLYCCSTQGRIGFGGH
jgi:hypothetical protein